MSSPPIKYSRWTGRTASRALTLLVGGWIIFVSFAAQLAAWVQEAIQNPPLLVNHWVDASLVQLVLIGAVVLPLASKWRSARYRAVFQSWAWAWVALLLLTPTRWLPPIYIQAATLLQLVIIGALWLGVRQITRKRIRHQPDTDAAQFGWTVGIVLLVTLPWLITGALGSPFDILLNGALGLATGAFVWSALRATWIPAQRYEPRGPRRDRFARGAVTGIMLVIVASGLSLNGVQLALMFALPAAVWVLLATDLPAWSIGLTTALLLMLIDSDAVNFLITDGLIIAYSISVLSTVLIGWFLALLTQIPRANPLRTVPRVAGFAAGGLMLLVAGSLYGTGHPGFYGDRTFVIMAQQADLSAIATDLPVDERRSQVYATLVEQANQSQGELRTALDRLGIAYTPYYLVNGLEVHGGLPVRIWLGLRDDVGDIMPSPVLRPTDRHFPEIVDSSESAPVAPAWNLTTIGADRVWSDFGARGAGIVIGQSDSGVQADHPELVDRYRGADADDNYNWYDPWYHEPAPYDLNGHGTHTLGTVAGATVGVAPDATWFACANLVRNLGNPAKYLDCLQFMLAPFPLDGDPLADGDPTRAADVLNNSWGCPPDVEGCDPTSLEPAVAALRTAGIFVVASAGNEGPACSTIDAPIALYDQSLSVGAINAARNLAFFSSVGPVAADGSGRTKPDLVAPGVDVLSAFPGNTYARLDGTSMAGPHVAGVVALMWSANPALIGDIDRTEAILLDTARPFTGTIASGLSLTDPGPPQDAVSQPEAATETATKSDAANSEAVCFNQIDLTQIPNNAVGYGVVDAYAAVAAARDLGE